jgi:general secretion pathway protein A
MYQSHWGMHDIPFRVCDVHRFYESPTHEEALARLLFLVEHHRRLGLLTGPQGSGKTLLLGVAAEQIQKQGGYAVQLNLLGIGQQEFLAQLAGGFGLPLRHTEHAWVVWRAIVDRIVEYRYERVDTVVLLDNADRADPGVVMQVARLAQHDWSPEARFTLILGGQRERLMRLDPALLELAELRVDLEPWEPSDTAAYVKSSLAQAGCPGPVFDEPALARLHELTHGIPRQVDQLADLALVVGAGQNLDHIDAQIVESVYQELQAGRL